jgi:TolB-like protein/Tfp pilus assembly protein PilF
LDKSGARLVLLGNLTLDFDSGRLIGPSGDVDIRPKTFAMLGHLAREAGKVVSKDDLMRHVWPNVIVSEDSLTQCAHDLRRALGADHSLLRTFPRRGYMLDIPEGGSTPVPGGPAEVPSGSIAVLPFAAPEGVSQRDRIVLDGLAHEMISVLASMRSFHVTGRGSAFAVRDLADDPFRVRQLLRVDYVVSGRVVAGNSGYRLMLDLVRTNQGSLVWTGDIAVGHDAAAAPVRQAVEHSAAAIAAAVTQRETSRATGVRDGPQAAWEALHCGLDQVFRFEPAAMARALDFFTTAVTLDPSFSRAYAFQSFCHYYFAFAELSASRRDSTEAAIRSAEKALDADGNGPAAHWAYGRALCLTGDPDGALRHLERAVDICPSFPHAHYMMGFIEANHRDAGRAFAHLDRTERLSPLDPFNASVQLTRGVSHLRLGDLDAAADHAARVVRHRNIYAQMLFPAAVMLMAAGREAEAREAAGRIRRHDTAFIPEKFFRSLYGLSDEVRRVFDAATSRLEL